MSAIFEIAATYNTTPQSVLPYQLAGLAVVLVLVVTPILVLRSSRRASRGETADAAIFAGVGGPSVPSVVSPGEVQIRFHTYSGLLVYFVQRKYDLIFPADQAKIVLGRMLKHNCTSGMLSPGCVFIPFLSYFEYRSQMKKVLAVLARGFPMDAH